MERANDRAVLVVAAVLAFDADEVVLLARVQLLDERRRFELFTVLAARDVARAGLVREARELADDEQHDRNGGGVSSCTAHGTTVPQMRQDCS